MTFDDAFDKLLGHEGGYVNNPADPGGETNWGVTLTVARTYGYAGSMRDFPRSTAQAIYRKQYWDAVHADQLPAALRYPVFDAAVNSGVKQSIKWLQRAVDVVDDGVLGPATLAGAEKADFLALPALLGYRLDFMTSLPAWSTFGKGWARRVASLLQEA